MIPKKIHYFWFSGDPYNDKIKECINSWQKHLFDYEIIKWDLTNTPIDCEFARKALAEKKWAFLSDYARLKVLSEFGGIYLDTDVLVVKSFNDLLSCESFWGRAQNGMVEPVVIGSKPGNKIVKDCLEHFSTKLESELFFQEIPLEIGAIFKKAGFIESNPKSQVLENAVVFSYDYFCPMPFEKADEKDPFYFVTNNTYGIHLWNSAWFDPFRFFWNGRSKAGWKAIRNTLIKRPLQDLQFYKSIFYHLKCNIFGYPKNK